MHFIQVLKLFLYFTARWGGCLGHITCYQLGKGDILDYTDQKRPLVIYSINCVVGDMLFGALNMTPSRHSFWYHLYRFYEDTNNVLCIETSVSTMLPMVHCGNRRCEHPAC